MRIITEIIAEKEASNRRPLHALRMEIYNRLIEETGMAEGMDTALHGLEINGLIAGVPTGRDTAYFIAE